LKAIVGSQRYGFILCLGFFVALYFKPLAGLAKFAVLVTILAGALLTFSRATIVALAGAGVIAIVLDLRPIVAILFRRPRWSSVGRAIIVMSLIVALAVVVAERLKDYWDFIYSRLIQPALTGQLGAAFFSVDFTSSEGARAYLTGLVLDYVAAHPFMGSNFAGLYLLYDELAGSASTHNQFADVLLRTGVLGFLLYAWLIAKIIQNFRADRGVLYGFIAILIYGMFHETFKLGHGSFVFGFLLSYQYWMRRRLGQLAVPQH
jgi:hypothetical protein